MGRVHEFIIELSHTILRLPSVTDIDSIPDHYTVVAFISSGVAVSTNKSNIQLLLVTKRQLFETKQEMIVFILHRKEMHAVSLKPIKVPQSSC